MAYPLRTNFIDLENDVSLTLNAAYEIEIAVFIEVFDNSLKWLFDP